MENKLNNGLMNGVYALENKRFEIIHVRSNKTTGFYECFMRDEYQNEDIAIYGKTISELHDKVKKHIDEAGLSIDLRTTPEPICYKP